MKQPANERDQVLLDAWIDGELDPVDSAVLAARLENEPALREEEAALRRLFEALDTSAGQIELGPEFADAVLARVSEPRRATTPARAIVAALGAAALLFAIALALGTSGRDLLGPGSVLLAIGDFATSTLLAGAGLLGASWRGVGEVVLGWLSASAWNAATAVVLVAASNVLLWTLLRRRARATVSRR